MLDLNGFVTIEGVLLYFGENHYVISTDGGNGYDVSVNGLDADGNAIEGERYACATLSAAVAIIEQLERGEEV